MWTEVIGQRVHQKYDQGVVVKSDKVDILSSDTVEELQQRALPVEHRVQIELLKDVASGNIKEIKRGEVLVNPGEEQVLFMAKRIARLLYPSG